MANIKRRPYPHHTTHRATELLQRIHCDICGPLPSCYGGYKYFILFICCYSRYITVRFMKSRDEALQCFIEFRANAETFCGGKTAIPRVNNAPELIRGGFERHCRSEGITYEKTVPDSPSQNGVAERCNLTLATMARAMLIDADLGDWFWPFAIQTAVHIKNRVPHSSLPPHKTPFEFWYRYKPDLSHLRPFGVACTARIISNNLSKFKPRGEAGRFLGYAKDAKGYLIWVPGTGGRGGLLKTRRDVVFHDFPPLQSVSSKHNDLSPLWDDVIAPDDSGIHEPSTLFHIPLHRDTPQRCPQAGGHNASIPSQDAPQGNPSGTCDEIEASLYVIKLQRSNLH
jgi:hypothetical protein